MDRKKRIFVLVALLFTMLMVYLGYDLMSRTTRPGQKKHLPTEIGR